jgi:threonine dehydrogenase-like Zn-dependent dehydrogenase
MTTGTKEVRQVVPQTCKAAVLEEYGKPMRLRDVPIPALEDRAILVKVELAGICGTDVHVQEGTLGLKTPLPNVLGHETIGRIVKLAPGRTQDISGERLSVGDRIMWAHEDCGECYWCEVAHQPTLCAKRSGYGFAAPHLLRGGFAEYEYITPATKVVRVPNEVTDEEAIGVGCAFRTVVAGYERLGGIGFQENVVVQGVGPVGLYSIVVARESGAGRVIAVGAPRQRLELAKRWGADYVIDIDEVKDPAERKARILQLTDGRGPQVVIECSGYPPAFNEGIEMIQKGGRYLVLGQTSTKAITFVPNAILGKSLTVIGSCSASATHFYKALQFIKNNRHKYPFADIVSNKYRLEEVNEALEKMKQLLEIKPVIDNRAR